MFLGNASKITTSSEKKKKKKTSSEKSLQLAISN